MIGIIKSASVKPLMFSKRFSTAGVPVFERDSTVTRVKDLLFRGHITDNWSMVDAPNGGFLMVMALNAAKQSVEHPDPLTCSGYYLNKALENAPVDIQVKILSKGRSSSTTYISLIQDGEVKSEFTAVFGNLDQAKGYSFSHKPPIALPPRNECFDASAAMRKLGKALKVSTQTEIRIPKDDPFANGLFVGKVGHRAALSCWIELTDKLKPRITNLPFYADALPPPILNLRPTNWVPTIELSVHFWARPPITEDEDSYWLRGRYETLHANNGFLYADGELWSADGKTLLATSRQFARVLEPRSKI